MRISIINDYTIKGNGGNIIHQEKLYQIDDNNGSHYISALDYDTCYFIDTMGKYISAFECLINDIKNLTSGNFKTLDRIF